MWRWLFAHPVGWFMAVMALWCALWLFVASLSALSSNDDGDAGDNDDREDSG
jgi:hypothetical protein